MFGLILILWYQLNMLNIIRTCFCVSRFIAVTVIIAGILFAPSIVNSDEERTFTSFIQKFATGRIDWDKGIVYGTGRAYLDQNVQSIPMAMRAAKLIAASNILKLAAGINLDDRRKLGELGDGNFVIHLKAFLRFAEHDARLVDNTKRPYYEVTRKTHLTGISGLNVQILKQIKSIDPDMLHFPQKAAEPITEGEDDPWLVLDARDLPNLDRVQPALFPKISTTTGETVYNLGSINPAALEKRPMVSYVESPEEARHLQSLYTPAGNLTAFIDAFLNTRSAIAEEGKIRKKRRRFIIKKVEGLQGLSKTNLVISQKDALALRQEDSASRILKNCRVIVIVSSPVGGVEGKLPGYIASR
jgi:hypothetical protein